MRALLAIVLLIFATQIGRPNWIVPAALGATASEDARTSAVLHVVRVQRVFSGNSDALQITFDAKSAELLRSITREAVGHRLSLLIGGQEIATLRIRDAILGSSIEITGDFDKTSFASQIQAASQVIEVVVTE